MNYRPTCTPWCGNRLVCTYMIMIQPCHEIMTQLNWFRLSPWPIQFHFNLQAAVYRTTSLSVSYELTVLGKEDDIYNHYPFFPKFLRFGPIIYLYGIRTQALVLHNHKSICKIEIFPLWLNTPIHSNKMKCFPSSLPTGKTYLQVY